MRVPREIKKDGLQCPFYCMVALFIGLAFVTTAAAASPGKKKLTAENIMDLLSGGVANVRIAFLVRERGTDFELTVRLERAFQDAGADQDLVQVLRGQSIPSPSPRALEEELPASQPESQVRAKPAPSTPQGMPTARLQIRSRPGDVAIFVDDELKGKTDPEDGRLEIAALKPGKHRLRASREGFQELEGTVDLAAGQVLETPVWLAKTEAPVAPAPEAPALPPGKKFLVRHHHRAFAGIDSGGFCQGWMIVNVGYIRYISTDSPHKYLMNTSEMRDAKADGGQGGFRIKLDFGRTYQFLAMDEKGQAVSAGPILNEIHYSMGE